jgi:Alw26I/Eco31I/Esp3I family type II restriction m6 adenine DNA methyltransferase
LSEILQNLEPVVIVELIGILHQKEKESETFANTNERKHLGIFYTDYRLARFITKETLKFKKIDPTRSTFLEPCSGTGNFVIAYLDEVLQLKQNQTKDYIQKVVNNIYCADIDKAAIELLKTIVPAYLKKKFGVSIKISPNNYYAGNVLFEIDKNKILKNDLKNIFGINDGFDIVITNPPYGLLKASANKYGRESNEKKSIKGLIDFVRQTNAYPLNEGTLNYYKLFVEEIISNLTNQYGVIGLLIPRTILNDRHSEKLRNQIFENYKLSTIYAISEKNDFFLDVAQAFCFFSINKAQKGKEISIIEGVTSEKDFEKKAVSTSISQLKEISSSIILESNLGMRILQKIHRNPRLASLVNVVNLRGELDLTLHKSFISTVPTKYRLVKGANVKEFVLATSQEYVTEDFLEVINGKHEYVKSTRIVCQQISNIHASKRLKFTFIERDYVLGNSCNFIALRTENVLFGGNGISLHYLLGILNSVLLDWRFRLSNSNNHVANYELNELPIVLDGDRALMDRIAHISSKLIEKYDEVLFAELNNLTMRLYNLESEEVAYVASRYPEANLKYAENKL